MPQNFSRRPLLLLLSLGASSLPSLAAPARRDASALIRAARKQLGVTRSYDGRYVSIAYPGGDVPRHTGVCTDVLIRAYRDAFAVDLQKLVHTDMAAHFSAYPRTWGLKRPDPHIDHRRVPNLQTFWARKQAKLPLPSNEQDWRPGDIFTSMIDGKLPHTGIVSDRRSASGRWAVIHNIGQGTREEDALTAHPLTGRYRFLV